METTSATPGLPATQQQETALAYPMGVPASPYGYMDDGESGGDGLTIAGLLHSLRRQLFPALGAGFVIASLLALGLWFMIPAVFRAEAVLRVNREESTGTPGDYMIYKETQAALLKSNFVITAALRDNDINQLPMVRSDDWGRERERPVAWLQGTIGVTADETELLFVRMTGRDKKQTEDILDSVISAYHQEVVNKERLEKVETLRKLRTRYVRLYETQKKKTDEVNKLAKALGAINDKLIAQEQQMKIAEMNKSQQDVDRQLLIYHEALDRYRLLNLQAQIGNSSAPDENLILDQLDKDQRYFTLSTEIDAYKDEIERLSLILKPGAPQIEEMNMEVGRKQRKLTELAQTLRPRVIARIRSSTGLAPSDLRNETLMQRQQIVSLHARLKRAEQAYIEKRAAVEAYGGNSGELEARMDDLMSTRKDVASVREEIQKLEIELEGRERVSIIQPATTPNDSNWFAKVSQVAGGWVISMLGVIVAIAYWDYLSKKVNTSEDLSRSLRVIGTLPSIQQSSFLPFGKMDRSEVEEAMRISVDGIRTAILYNREIPSQTVLVTSATGQEGRSTLASQLAVSMARAGKTTLLIDGDLHNPQQQGMFGAQASGGLCEMLRGEQTSDQAIVPTDIENVWLLTAGRCDQTALQGLAGEQATAVFDDFKDRFDCIIIDGSPVLTGAEVLLLGQNADAAILSVRRDVSQLPKVNAAGDRLASVSIPVLGAVVNGTNIEMRKGGDLPAVEPAEEQPALTNA